MSDGQRGLIPAAEAADLRPLPLFAYGTLLDAEFLGHLLERPVAAEPARLEGYRVEILAGFDWPVLVAEEGGTVEGRLYAGLGPVDLERLDAYEGVGEGLYRRVEVVAEAVRIGRVAAWVYLPTERTLRRRA